MTIQEPAIQRKGLRERESNPSPRQLAVVHHRPCCLSERFATRPSKRPDAGIYPDAGNLAPAQRMYGTDGICTRDLRIAGCRFTLYGTDTPDIKCLEARY